jgi:hypothetical protein
MGSGASREAVISEAPETVINSRWWEAEAHDALTTATDPRKVEKICLFIPVLDDKTLLRPLMARPDLDTLFTFHCGRELPGHVSEHPSNITDDMKAQELLRVLRPVSEGHGPWDWNWPLSGDPRQIADDFDAAVFRAVLQVPPLDFVKCALGYRSQVIHALINNACDIKESLQNAMKGCPHSKDTYVQVEEVSYTHL